MAITRTQITERTIALAEVGDDGRVSIAVADGRFRVTASLTLDEAEQFAREITDAVIEAGVINNEGATA